MKKYSLVMANGNYEEYSKRVNPLNLSNAGQIELAIRTRREYDRIGTEFINQLSQINIYIMQYNLVSSAERILDK